MSNHSGNGADHDADSTTLNAADNANSAGAVAGAPFPDFSEDLLKIARMRMPFGKYAGHYLIDLPENYVSWFARNGFPDGEIGRLLSLLNEVHVNHLTSLFDPLRVSQMDERR